MITVIIIIIINWYSFIICYNIYIYIYIIIYICIYIYVYIHQMWIWISMYPGEFLHVPSICDGEMTQWPLNLFPQWPCQPRPPDSGSSAYGMLRIEQWSAQGTSSCHWGRCWWYQWIGLRETFNRKAPYLMGKSMVSG